MHYLSSEGQKIQKLKKDTVSVYIFGFIFYRVSRAKPNLDNKYMI